MKIAVPTRNDRIDDHFGHCDHFSIFTVEDNKIVKEDTLASPQGCGCKSNLCSQLKKMGITVMLAGNMGEGALNKLKAHDITVFRGCHGAVKDCMDSYLNHTLVDSGTSCAAHHHEQHAHQCGQHKE